MLQPHQRAGASPMGSAAAGSGRGICVQRAHLAGEGTAAVRTPAAVGVNDDLAACGQEAATGSTTRISKGMPLSAARAGIRKKSSKPAHAE